MIRTVKQQLIAAPPVCGVLLDVAEVEGVGLVARHGARRRELAHDRGEVVEVAAVVEQFDLANQLNFDPDVLDLLARRT